ncbi:MAG: hypothetical protein AAGB93_02555 [Planctomycetota bacterium]
MSEPQTDAAPRGGDPLLRVILRLVLGAAIVTAPLFLFGEGFEAEYVGRVAASNGACAALCVGLLALERRGRARLAAQLLVGGLLALVGLLAWINGEPVHVNVINFTLVTVLASALLDGRAVAVVATLCALEMTALAWTRPLERAGADLAEQRFESIVQILPTFVVVAWILAIRSRVSSR